MPRLIFTSADLTNPQGANSLSSYALFFQRMLYKEKIFPSHLATPLDTWYNKQYYGMVDQRQNTIMVNPGELKPIKSTIVTNLLALGFVTDAFEDFAAHMKKAAIVGMLNQSGNEALYSMKAKRAYVNPNAVYSVYLQEVYNTFIKGLSKKDLNNIIDYNTFAAKFMEYLLFLSKVLPITKTNYLLSGVCSSINSGLTIAIANGPADNDAYKYEKFIADPNFDFYLRSATKFGFTVNKNMPWLLTADLFSDAILGYITRYVNTAGDTINAVNFFDTFYNPTYLEDIPALEQLIINGYKNFVSTNPIYQVETFRLGQPGCNMVHVENEYRSPLPPDPGNILTDKKMLYFYAQLRSAEAKNALPITPKISQEIKDVYLLQPNKDINPLQNAAAYINLLYRDYIYSVDYAFLSDILSQKNLDNQARTGTISTAGAVTQQLY